MKIFFKRSFLEFDKVEIFEGFSAEGESYLGLLVEEYNNKDIYCVIPVLKENLLNLENGDIELRKLFELRTKNEWFIAETENISEEPIDLITPKVTNIPQNYLPKEGFYMSKNLNVQTSNRKKNERDNGYRRETKRDLTNIFISFLLGSVASVLITVFFSYDNPIKDWIIGIFNPNYDKIESVEFESVYKADGNFSVKLVWGDVAKADSFKISRRQINFDNFKIFERENAFSDFVCVGNDVRQCNFEDNNVQTGIYVYKIEVLENTKTISYKEFVWFHRFKVKIASNKINVRSFGDWCFSNQTLGQLENKNRMDEYYGFTLLGPITNNCKYEDEMNQKEFSYKWWNIIWNNGLVGWSVQDAREEQLLFFENTKGKGIDLDKIYP